MPAVITRSCSTETTAPTALRLSYRIHRNAATAIRNTTTASSARWEISEPQVSDTAESETPLAGAYFWLIAPFAATTWSTVRVDELIWTWVPTVCTASGSTPVAEVTTRATSLVEMDSPGFGWNCSVVPPAKSMPNWKPRNTISRIEMTTKVPETA